MTTAGSGQSRGKLLLSLLLLSLLFVNPIAQLVSVVGPELHVTQLPQSPDVQGGAGRLFWVLIGKLSRYYIIFRNSITRSYRQCMG